MDTEQLAELRMKALRLAVEAFKHMNDGDVPSVLHLADRFAHYIRSGEHRMSGIEPPVL